MKFALLASGSKGNCCLIRNGKTSIVIDCGGTRKYLSSCFDRLSYDYMQADALFVTHGHTDHIQQLKMFNDVDTYATCALDTSNYYQMQPYDTIELATLEVQALPTSHDADNSCGYVITSDSEKLVYITDTGYISEAIKPYIKNADYYIFESNHDIEMLMATNRPLFVKQRIIGDTGHLCNEDSAEVLAEVIGKKTKEIVLAHISEEGNSYQHACQILKQTLLQHHVNVADIKITAAPQFEIIRGGHN
ncbi:MBL fold metallo-hydrolase [Erysipelotrichaceae bacterium MTC7]|nr:MBL fold metallo-hydrolase [Erysipelotrichaceae bacterium MTC7]